MILIPGRKFVYIRVPKTGSTSTTAYLLERLKHYDDLVCSKPESHIKVDEKKINYDLHIHSPIYNLESFLGYNEANLRDYRAFAVIREPVDWVISVACDSARAEEIKNKSNDEIVNRFLDEVNHPPQKVLLEYRHKPLSDIFLYEEIELMLLAMSNYLNFSYQPNPYRFRDNRRADKSTVLTKKTINRIYDRYFEDLELYNTLKQR